jgi:hypothetical protein
MSTATILVSLSTVWFSVIAAHGFALMRSEDYRGFWGAVSLALLPGVCSAIYLSTDPGVAMNLRRVIFSGFGGLIGIATANWLGYAVTDWRAGAQTTPAETAREGTAMTPQGPALTRPATPSSVVVGATIVGNGQGGPAADVVGTDQQAPAAKIAASGCGGQSVTGLSVTQTGPGTGLRIVQSGPGTGMRVTATAGGPGCSQ